MHSTKHFTCIVVNCKEVLLLERHVYSAVPKERKVLHRYQALIISLSEFSISINRKGVLVKEIELLSKGKV